MTYLLDTSALMAHVLSEPGWETVDRLLQDHSRDVAISVITWLEFNVLTRAIAPEIGDAEEVLALYRELLAEAIPVSRGIAEAALALRLLSPQRLPTADALIAATAEAQGATLVHRDPHLAGISGKRVKQICLPEKVATSQRRKA